MRRVFYEDCHVYLIAFDTLVNIHGVISEMLDKLADQINELHEIIAPMANVVDKMANAYHAKLTFIKHQFLAGESDVAIEEINKNKKDYQQSYYLTI